LDENGWADVEELLIKAKIDRDILEEVVADNDKQRFAFNDDHTKIRASQGHSLKINLDLESMKPPYILYHGTVRKFLDSIFKKGLTKGKRQYVHLSKDIETAKKVGQRRGSPVILEIDSAKMYRKGFKFFLSKNGVWLTYHVPPIYIKSA